MSPNRKLVEAYFATTDRSRLAPLLTEDVECVEWANDVPLSGVVHRGRKEYIENSGSDELHPHITRWVEEGDTVVAEGTVRVHSKDGKVFHVRFVDIFELDGGKIRRKSSYGALLKDSA